MRLIGLAVVLALSLTLAPLAAETQPAAKVYRIGFLGHSTPTQQSASLDAFRHGLRELGWVEGQNVSIEYRWADGNLDRLPALAADLLKQQPVDVMLVASTGGVRAVQQASRTVPIVAAIMGDPVATGFAASLARPGGSVTGSAVQFEDLVTKQLQILKETVPKATRVAILAPTSLVNSNTLKAAEGAARTLGLKGRVFEIRDVPDLEGTFRTAKAEHADAVHVLPSPASRNLRLSTVRLGLRSFGISGPPVRSLPLRPGDSLTILSMAWSVGFRVLVSLHPATRVTGL